MIDLIELAKKLIACPSITPNDAGCQTLISHYLTPLGFHCESMRFGQVDNLWATIGNQGPLIVFAGHTDVVPTGPLSEWDYPPFQPAIHEGNLHGRGAADMKGALAAMVISVSQFIKQHPHFPATIAFLITSDEEGPSVDGTKKVIEVLQHRGIKIDYCIIGEPSSSQHIGDQIRIGRRGSLHGKLRIQGKQGHVAHPHLAVNPIHNSLLALHALAHNEWDQGNQDFPPTTFQITNLHSGTGAANVIPGHLDVLFNFRFSGECSIQQLQEYTEAILHPYGLTHHIEWLIGAYPFLTRTGKLINMTKEAIHKVTGIETILSTGGGTSDGRFIAPTGAEIIELGTLHATAHQLNEHVSIQGLQSLANIYFELLKMLIL
jgi:succinyl-diaminopimelate desuccinylase